MMMKVKDSPPHRGPQSPSMSSSSSSLHGLKDGSRACYSSSYTVIKPSSSSLDGLKGGSEDSYTSAHAAKASSSSSSSLHGIKEDSSYSSFYTVTKPPPPPSSLHGLKEGSRACYSSSCTVIKPSSSSSSLDGFKGGSEACYTSTLIVKPSSSLRGLKEGSLACYSSSYTVINPSSSALDGFKGGSEACHTSTHIVKPSSSSSSSSLHGITEGSKAYQNFSYIGKPSPPPPPSSLDGFKGGSEASYTSAHIAKPSSSSSLHGLKEGSKAYHTSSYIVKPSSSSSSSSSSSPSPSPSSSLDDLKGGSEAYYISTHIAKPSSSSLDGLKGGSEAYYTSTPIIKPSSSSSSSLHGLKQGSKACHSSSYTVKPSSSSSSSSSSSTSPSSSSSSFPSPSSLDGLKWGSEAYYTSTHIAKPSSSSLYGLKGGSKAYQTSSYIVKPFSSSSSSSPSLHGLKGGSKNYYTSHIVKLPPSPPPSSDIISRGNKCSRSPSHPLTGNILKPAGWNKSGASVKPNFPSRKDTLPVFDRALTNHAPYRSNRAAALASLGRLPEAVAECEDALKLDPSCLWARRIAASLYLRLGLVESCKKKCSQPDLSDILQRIQVIEKHVSKCIDSRKAGDWKTVMRESDAAVVSGADSAYQIFGYKVEALLKILKLEEADLVLTSAQRLESALVNLGVIRPDPFLLAIRSQVDMAMGRFEAALLAAERAVHLDPENKEIMGLLRKAQVVCNARASGNELFKEGRFFEACVAYGEGLDYDHMNAILLCNRAACRSKLQQWEKAIEDCNASLSVQPSYSKALLRRANCHAKLEKWESALRDYEVLSIEMPGNMEVARGLFDVQIAMKKARGEDVRRMKFGGEVEEVSGNDQYKEAVSSSGLAVVEFKAKWSEECKGISPFVDQLCKRYPAANFLKVDVDKNPILAKTECIRLVPTFKIYKDGFKVKEILGSSQLQEALENARRQHTVF